MHFDRGLCVARHCGLAVGDSVGAVQRPGEVGASLHHFHIATNHERCWHAWQPLPRATCFAVAWPCPHGCFCCYRHAPTRHPTPTCRVLHHTEPDNLLLAAGHEAGYWLSNKACRADPDGVCRLLAGCLEAMASDPMSPAASGFRLLHANDFGGAIVQGTQPITAARGTPAFMPPEAQQGYAPPEAYTPASDVYTLGVMFGHMVGSAQVPTWAQGMVDGMVRDMCHTEQAKRSGLCEVFTTLRNLLSITQQVLLGLCD